MPEMSSGDPTDWRPPQGRMCTSFINIRFAEKFSQVSG